MLIKIRNIEQINTPALLLDIDAVNRNIKKMADFFRGKECKLRPHCKTHKLPIIAKKQIDAGAIGITCATILEAEVMQDAGIESILIANQIVNSEKIEKLVQLCRAGEVMVCVDNIYNIRDLDRAAGKASIKIPVLIEIDVGLERCGVAPSQPALDMVKQVSECKNLPFLGITGYEGGMFLKDVVEKKQKCSMANKLLVETKELIENAGFKVGIVSAGGSNTYDLAGLYPGITEIQPGSYVTMDRHNREFGLDFEQAIFVLTT